MSVTIKDIAREAGVSYASVSRALSGNRGVSMETSKRILEVAKRLNYSPNGIARHLVNQRSKTLGLILPDISNPFFADIALAVILLFVGLLFFSEKLSLNQLIGIVLCVAGLFFLNRR